MRHGFSAAAEPRHAEVSFPLALHGRLQQLFEEQKSHSLDCFGAIFPKMAAGSPSEQKIEWIGGRSPSTMVRKPRFTVNGQAMTDSCNKSEANSDPSRGG
jgi:hypothetical protein